MVAACVVAAVGLSVYAAVGLAVYAAVWLAGSSVNIWGDSICSCFVADLRTRLPVRFSPHIAVGPCDDAQILLEFACVGYRVALNGTCAGPVIRINLKAGED